MTADRERVVDLLRTSGRSVQWVSDFTSWPRTLVVRAGLQFGGVYLEGLDKMHFSAEGAPPQQPSHGQQPAITAPITAPEPAAVVAASVPVRLRDPMMAAAPKPPPPAAKPGAPSGQPGGGFAPASRRPPGVDLTLRAPAPQPAVPGSCPHAELLAWGQEHGDPRVILAATHAAAALADLEVLRRKDTEQAALRAEIAALEEVLEAKRAALGGPGRSAEGPDQAATRAKVRTWARANKIRCPDAGRIPGEVLAAYRRANPLPT